MRIGVVRLICDVLSGAVVKRRNPTARAGNAGGIQHYPAESETGKVGADAALDRRAGGRLINPGASQRDIRKNISDEMEIATANGSHIPQHGDGGALALVQHGTVRANLLVDIAEAG